MRAPLIGGVLLGMLCWLGDRVTGEANALAVALTWLGNIGATWVLLAAMIGRASGGARTGAARGAFSLGTAAMSYYGLAALTGGRGDAAPGDPARLVLFWLAVSAGGGAVFGALGQLARPEVGWKASAALAILGGALAAEALAYLFLSRDYLLQVWPYTLGATIELGGAALWPWLVLRDRGALAATAGALGLAVPGAFLASQLTTVLYQSGG